MAFVITTECCNDASCVEVCPVDCIRPHPEDPEFRTAEQLYIDPESCIDCSACMYACPVSAIYDELELPEHLSDFVAHNRDYFLAEPLSPRFVAAPERVPEAAVGARVAVIGTGPSACYAIAELTAVPGVEVSVFERLPTPFGLVRSGVAPDHPHTRLVAEYFESVLGGPNVTCYFNVEVGTHVTIDEVRASHHAVIYAGGAADDRMLEIDGESLPGSLSAREFVSWYNGHPDFADYRPDLRGDTAVVLGNGNVALDVARVLVRSAEELATTDIADHALSALSSSAIREVVIVARRGPADAACTFPELLELTRVSGVEVRVPKCDVDFDFDEHRSLTVVQRRKLELFQRLSQEDQFCGPAPARRVTFRFGREPVGISGGPAVDAVHLRPTGSPAGPLEVVRTSLALRAVGYAVSPVVGLPFDHATRTLRHIGGRLIEQGSTHTVPGLYAVGWAKRGPSGVIGTNKLCAQETVGAVLADLRARLLAEPTATRSALEGVIRERQPLALDLAGWRAIDLRERQDGRTAVPPKPRRKLVRVETMLDVAMSATPAAMDGISENPGPSSEESP